MNFALEMQGITKEFPGVRALDDLTLRVRPGTVQALLGENGAGKSTSLHHLGLSSTSNSTKQLEQSHTTVV